jgi:UDP-glucose 4-epimerase
MTILVTGGAGYIGSHTVVQLLEKNEQVIILDDLSNSSVKVLDRIAEITGKKPIFFKGNVSNVETLEQVFSSDNISSVIHFAGYKAVGESVEKPLMYYQNNLLTTLSLLDVMQRFNCKKFVFSSSATVYGDPEEVPITEQSPLSATNPYGQTKLMLENILKDIAYADETMRIAVLRYFNPVGAHGSGLMGENPRGIPNNLMPFIAKVAVGELKELSVFGDDYQTQDGTGVRDYIHVLDLADGHLAALEKLNNYTGWNVYNLGTGKGYSVLEMVNTFAEVSGREIPYKIVDRRAGDVPIYLADVELSNRELGWSAKADLTQMIEDHWRWQKNNPKGYE